MEFRGNSRYRTALSAAIESFDLILQTIFSPRSAARHLTLPRSNVSRGTSARTRRSEMQLQPKGNTDPKERFHVPSGIGKAAMGRTV
jgi:hypothetical protein